MIELVNRYSGTAIRAFATVELKSYNVILALSIYQKSHTGVEVKL